MSGELVLPANATLPDIVRHEISVGRATPETVREMLALQIAWEKREAEKEFIAARARLKFPPIPKTKHGTQAKYAPWDSVQEIIDPILEREGFTLSFTSGEPNEKNLIPITGKLSHRLGHSETGTVYQPIAAVSRGMNANQAMGSAVSYGERYCAAMMLNLRFVGMDDDANTFSVITDHEREQLEDLMAECGIKPGSAEESKFLAACTVKALGDLTRGQAYDMAMGILHRARRRMGQQPPEQAK
jgi:hypothetical protein